MTVSYLCLHHEGPVHAQVVDDAVHVHYVFPLDLEEQTVDGDEGACTSNTGTECRQRRREQRQRERQNIR